MTSILVGSDGAERRFVRFEVRVVYEKGGEQHTCSIEQWRKLYDDAGDRGRMIDMSGHPLEECMIGNALAMRGENVP